MRSKVATAADALDAARAREKRVADLRAGAASALVEGAGADAGSLGETLMYVGTAFLLVIVLSLGAAWLMMRFYGGN